MEKSTQGFTLIELILVVSIIGILTSTGLRTYLTYQKRSKVAEAFVLSIAVKKAVTDYYAYHGKFPADNQQAGLLAPPFLRGHYVAGITVEKGTIRAHFFDSVHITGELIFTPLTVPNFPELYWDCKSHTTLADVYRPSSCK